MTSVFLAGNGNHLSKSGLRRTPLHSSVEVFDRNNMVMHNDRLNMIIVQWGKNAHLFSAGMRGFECLQHGQPRHVYNAHLSRYKEIFMLHIKHHTTTIHTQMLCRHTLGKLSDYLVVFKPIQCFLNILVVKIYTKSSCFTQLKIRNFNQRTKWHNVFPICFFSTVSGVAKRILKQNYQTATLPFLLNIVFIMCQIFSARLSLHLTKHQHVCMFVFL